MNRPGMVGREFEQAELTAALDDARQGRGRTVMVLGEPGMGKSTLADWLAQHASAAGLRVARGPCSAAGMPPLWPWRCALDSIAIPVPWRDVATPWSPSDSDPEFVAAATVDAIRSAARQQPLLLVMEDLHWADPTSLVVLRLLVDAVPGLPVMVLLTCRDDRAEAPEQIRGLLADLPTGVRRVPLSPIDRAAVADLARRVSGQPLSDQDVAEVHRRTGGNPFFVHEVARLLVTHREATRLVVPPGVHEVLRRRLARLPQPCVGALAVAAIVAEASGDVVDADLLAAALGVDEAAAVPLLDCAVTAGLLDPDPADPARHRFRHTLVREVLVHDLPAAERGRLHALVAETLESRPADGALVTRITHHWCRASGARAAERAAGWSLRAAREAMSQSGFEAAALHFARALEHPSTDRAAVSVEYGEALQLGGDVAAARAVLLRAAREARQPADLARAALALGGGVAGFEVAAHDDEQTALLRRADADLPHDEPALRAAVRARLSVALAGTVPDTVRVDLAEQATATARRVGDQEIETAAQAAYCDAVAGPDFVSQRVVAATRMLELSSDRSGTDVRRRAGALLAHRLLLVARLEQGDLVAADEQARAYEHLVARSGVARYRWLPEIWRGMRALLQGDPDRALRHADSAGEIGRAADSLNARLMAFTVRMQAHLDRGTPEQFVDEIDAVLTEIGPRGMPPMYYATPARALLAAGDAGHARAALRTFHAGTDTTMPRDAEWLECHWALVDIALTLDDRRTAEVLYAALRPYESLWAVDGLGAAVFGVVAEQLGRLAERLGRCDDAARHLHTARETYLRQGVPALIARVAAVGDLPAPADSRSGLLRRDGRVWVIEWHGRRSTVPDSKGVRDLAVLLVRPGQAMPVLELVAAAGGPPAAIAGADLGPLIDDTARRAYRRRLSELDRDIDEADSAADLGRLERLRSERSLLVGQLTAAFGLGGRARIAGDPVERARKAVTMRLRAAISAIGEADDALARHLRNTVRTGRLCGYEPESPVTWRS
jgi:hypothetical protein